MPQIGWAIGRERLTYDEALQQAKAGAIPYPPAFLRALQSDRADQVPSPSTLAGCLRAFELKRTTDYYIDPAKLVKARLFGTGAHEQLEKAHRADSGTAEMNMAAMLDLPGLPVPYDRLELRGTTDNVDPESGTVLDWKTTGYIGQKFNAYPEHRAQVNVYAWLWHKNNPDAEPLTKWRIFYISRGGGIPTYDAHGELKPLADVERWIVGRLRAWAEPVSRGQLPQVHPDYFKEGKTAGSPFGCCSWCDLRAECLERD